VDRAAPTHCRRTALPPTGNILLHAKPHASFQAGSGRRYSADEDGKIECNDADDRHDLIRSGCQEQR
jgi:hypothetical protein